MQPRLTGIGAARKGQQGRGLICNQRTFTQLRIGAAVAGLACSALATARAGAPETIGTWKLACPDGAPVPGCTLRHKDASLQAGGYAVALEVQSVNGALVPVVAVRGVPSQNAIGTLLSIVVGLRLDKAAWIELPCNEALFCAPRADSLPGLAVAFPAAASIRLRLEVTLPGGQALPQPEHEFDLSGTKRALERLKESGTITTSAPATTGLDWKAMMQKLWKVGGG